MSSRYATYPAMAGSERASDSRSRHVPQGNLANALLPVAPISFPVTAQPCPGKPLRIIVPYSPGSASDIISRIVAKSLEENIGQSVVIENRPSANSIIGLELAAKAVPDGYTLVISPAPMISSLHNKLPYDPNQD